MNTKEMIVSIVTAMLVMTMFASSAMAITVDGEINPSDEWDVYDEMITDNVGDTCSTGYDITSLWMRVEGDTLFVRMDIDGVPGDADNDGNPDTHTNTDQNSCGCPIGEQGDFPGVGVGADPINPTVEEYIALIDGDNDDAYDYSLKYQLGESSLYASAKIDGATTVAAHGGIVELSVAIDQYCVIDPTNYCVKGSADTDCNGNEDYTVNMCHVGDPPEARFDFTPGDCGEGRLDATASTDSDGTIVSYDWDFDNDGDYDDATGDIVDPYTIGGLNYVCLMVTDDSGQSNITCQWVRLTDCPIAVAKANGDSGPNVRLQDGGEMVEFSGTDSYHPDAPDAWIVSCAWVVDSGKTSDKCTMEPYFIDDETTATLTVTDNFGCTCTDTITLIAPPQQVPFLTPVGMVALIGMLCIVGAGRILTKGRRS